MVMCRERSLGCWSPNPSLFPKPYFSFPLFFFSPPFYITNYIIFGNPRRRVGKKDITMLLLDGLRTRTILVRQTTMSYQF